jgi:hypothetical protein
VLIDLAVETVRSFQQPRSRRACIGELVQIEASKNCSLDESQVRL